MKWLTDSDIADIVRDMQPKPAAAPAAMFALETPRDASELLRLLNRAVNTLDQRAWPAWLPDWFERLERMQ